VKVLLLAGGEGSRLFPYTTISPKCLLPVGGRPLLMWIVEKLKAENFNDLTILGNTRFEDQFRHHIRVMKFLYGMGVGLVLSEDSEELGTGGELLRAEEEGQIAPDKEEPFMVYYSDILAKFNFREMAAMHFKHNPAATLAISLRLPSEKGVVKLTGHHPSQVRTLKEKPLLMVPTWCGIGVFTPQVLQYVKKGDDLSRDVIPRALKAKQTVLAYTFQTPYLDLGSISSYREACRMAAEGKIP